MWKSDFVFLATFVVFLAALAISAIVGIRRNNAKSAEASRRHEEFVQNQLLALQEYQKVLGDKAFRLLNEFVQHHPNLGFSLSYDLKRTDVCCIQIDRPGALEGSTKMVLKLEFHHVRPNGTNNACVKFVESGFEVWFSVDKFNVEWALGQSVYPVLQEIVDLHNWGESQR